MKRMISYGSGLVLAFVLSTVQMFAQQPTASIFPVSVTCPKDSTYLGNANISWSSSNTTGTVMVTAGYLNRQFQQGTDVFSYEPSGYQSAPWLQFETTYFFRFYDNATYGAPGTGDRLADTVVGCGGPYG